MGRWTQYDEDKYRLDGLRRVAYDADTQTYIYADENGQQYLGVPGSQYDIASPLRDDPAADRPQAFDTGRPKPTLDVKSLPTTFQDFLPASAITTPTASGAKTGGSSSSSGHSGFFDAARRATLPKFAGVVDGIKRSATTAPKSTSRVEDEKRSLLRNPLASKRDEKRNLGRSQTAPWKPSSQQEKKGIPPPPLPHGGKLPEVFEKQRSTTMGPGLETTVDQQMKALSLGRRHPPPARKPVPAFSPPPPPSQPHVSSQGQFPVNDNSLPRVPPLRLEKRSGTLGSSPDSDSYVSRGRQMKRGGTQLEKRDSSSGSDGQKNVS